MSKCEPEEIHEIHVVPSAEQGKLAVSSHDIFWTVLLLVKAIQEPIPIIQQMLRFTSSPKDRIDKHQQVLNEAFFDVC